jgi:Ca2+-binding RTX toxin-like protein
MTMAKIDGTNGADTLYGTSAADQISGLGGNDTLKGFGGADRLDGGLGIDTVFYGDSTVGVAVNLVTGRGFRGSAEGDTLFDIEDVFGSNHNDTLIGEGRANELHGANGNDILKGGGGADQLFGDSGDDILQGGTGGDAMDGGTGTDTADYSQATDRVMADLRMAPNTSGAAAGEAVGDTFISIENLTGSVHADFLLGTDGANVMRGGDGHDGFLGFDGNDTLIGGNGNDNHEGGAGSDLMIGGPGDDLYRIDSAGDVAVENPGEGRDGINSAIDFTLGATFENLSLDDGGAITAIGNAVANHIHGNDNDNILDGRAGADTFQGRGGNDTYFVDDAGDRVFESGGQGIDVVRTSVSYTLTPGADIELIATTSNSGTAPINLTGNANGNVVIGNDGNNFINGGDGRDELTGAGGQDFFVFDTPLNAASNVDIIGDFNVADDTIQLHQDVFASLSAASGLLAGQFVIGTAAQDADDHVIYDSATGALFYDSDGNGAASQVQFARLSAGLALSHLDFFVTG